MKTAERRESEGLVVREVVTPEVSSRGAEGTDMPYDPGEITAAWKMAVKGLYNQIAFGAMLCDLETVLTRENGAKKMDEGYGTGLQGWLSDNCPAVNYKTAMRWKQMAAGVSAALQDAGTPLPARFIPVAAGILPPPEGESFDFDKGKTALAKMLEGRSQRDVWASLRGPGRPKGTPGGGRKALTAGERSEDAEREIMELIGKLAAYCAGPKLGMLREETRIRTAATLKDISESFRSGRALGA